MPRTRACAAWHPPKERFSRPTCCILGDVRVWRRGPIRRLGAYALARLLTSGNREDSRGVHPAAHPPRLSTARTTPLPSRPTQSPHQSQLGVDGLDVTHARRLARTALHPQKRSEPIGSVAKRALSHAQLAERDSGSLWRTATVSLPATAGVGTFVLKDHWRLAGRTLGEW
jgi:hypothetical protein